MYKVLITTSMIHSSDVTHDLCIAVDTVIAEFETAREAVEACKRINLSGDTGAARGIGCNQVAIRLN